MLGPPVDAWPLWVGLTLASAAALGVVTELPRTAPPDATALARTVDGVAASDHAAVGEHPLRVDAIRVGPDRVALRRGDTVERATLRYGPVAPAFDGRLATVLHGRPPDAVFDSRAAFAAAVRQARVESIWQPAPDHLLVRRVTWEGEDVTLVG